MNESDWSVSEREVLATARTVLESDRRAVLATVVNVEGSAYRRPGAKMVVPEDGDGVGHITAGCLEDEVYQLAGEVIDAGTPRVETYDLRPDAEGDVWGLGVGCNGVIDILLEPLEGTYRPVLDAVTAGRNIGVVTVTAAGAGAPLGARCYYDPDAGEFSLGPSFPATLAERIEDVVADLATAGQSDSIEIDGATVFVDGVAAPDDLVVVGTGNDVGPIVDLGTRAGFRVTVVGFRGANATVERFPSAADVRSTSPPRIREAVDLDEDTYVVVATHNFVDDRLALDELLRTDVPYVGLMGPRERFEEMLAEFESEGRTFSEGELSRVYTPVGLDLGDGSPHGIAISIVSEVLAVSNGRRPGHLKDREGPIHDRIELPPDD